MPQFVLVAGFTSAIIIYKVVLRNRWIGQATHANDRNKYDAQINFSIMECVDVISTLLPLTRLLEHC